jgi:1-deoxy-D-xylulose-5-phosphate synthase
LAFGSLVTPALQAGEQLNASVADMRFVKPIDHALIEQLARTHELLVTLEENAVMGGAGSAVSEYLHYLGIPCKVLQLGLPDEYIEHGDHTGMLRQCGLDATGILSTVLARLSE